MFRGIKSLKKPDSYMDKIRCAVNETIYNKLSLEEKDRINGIEQIRKKFTQNPTPVDITDFGAGNPDSKRSDDEMLKGITHSTTYGAICLGSKPSLWALLLFKLIKEFQPQTALELGTCIGISAAYQATSQKMNGKGTLITMEGAESIARLAEKNIASLHLDNVKVVCGRFGDTLPKVLKENQTIDYVFIDGHHDENATVDYYEMLLPHLSPRALLVFDDISWSEGMKRAWKKISCDEKILLSVDLTMLGICVMK
ncbi:O-methyltransferase [Bacteroidia bacterium]|nr:O-methyltransferase [Bacteroidia bacterium]GHV70903.1 O-methyltransferase [Bacteroidia bacterium]